MESIILQKYQLTCKYMVKQKWYIRKTKQLFLGWMFICVFVTQAFWSVPTAHAWDAALGAIVHRALDTVYEQLEGAILGTLKVSAIKILNSKVAQMVGGSSVGDALFITDWGDFLYNTPAEKTKLFMNDFFTLTTRGKYASANYVGIGDVAGNVSGNYAGYLRSRAENSIGVFYSGTQSYFEYDLDQYADNPERMFQEGDWRGFNAFFSNPMNNPLGYELMNSINSAYNWRRLGDQYFNENQHNIAPKRDSSKGRLNVSALRTILRD